METVVIVCLNAARFALRIDLVIVALLLFSELINASGVMRGSGSIAFVSSTEGNPDIFLMDIDRGIIRRLTDHPADDLRPSWSPDGRRIVFYSNRDGFWNLYVMRANGLDVQPITTERDSFGNPAWSPDGQRVAYDTTMAGNLEIYIMCVENKCTTQRLTSQAGPDEFPAWSPDGQRIAYQALRTERREIYVMDVCERCKTQPQLLYTGFFSHAGPAWSPDGRHLAFAAASTNQWGIYVVDAKCYAMPGGCAGNIQQLTASSMNSFQPAWSPDGRSIVFQGWVEGNMELFIMDIEGNNLRRLTFNHIDDRLPAWWP
jgi:Tol biopolymer transport system component